MSKILYFDIETTNLSADFGRILAFGWKWDHESKINVKDITEYSHRFDRDPTDDKALVKEAKEILEQADIWVTWYGTYFDVPFIQTRLLAHRFTPLPPTAHDDGWRTARYALKLHSNRLKSVSEFLGIKEKTPLLPVMWTRAAAGHKQSIKYVVEHCRQDVAVLSEAYKLLRPWIKQPSNILIPKTKIGGGTTYGCPRCGCTKLQKRGITIAKTSWRQRYQCTECGGWSSSSARQAAILR